MYVTPPQSALHAPERFAASFDIVIRRTLLSILFCPAADPHRVCGSPSAEGFADDRDA
ncbi:hypothetical protein [Haloprofundus marisrubri]|uniref:hypothetical protein n=1 Tax=Haloprofundus marisrubri TaxID=1514971 RepID=UPI0012BA7698|nr:hypothetical protein [Haloprofundus marisrubri]